MKGVADDKVGRSLVDNAAELLAALTVVSPVSWEMPIEKTPQIRLAHMVHGARHTTALDVAAVKLVQVGELLAEPLNVVALLGDGAGAVELDSFGESVGCQRCLEAAARLGQLLGHFGLGRWELEDDADNDLTRVSMRGNVIRACEHAHS